MVYRFLPVMGYRFARYLMPHLSLIYRKDCLPSMGQQDTPQFPKKKGTEKALAYARIIFGISLLFDIFVAHRIPHCCCIMILKTALRQSIVKVASKLRIKRFDAVLHHGSSLTIIGNKLTSF